MKVPVLKETSLGAICGLFVAYLLCSSHTSFVTNTNTELVDLLPKTLFAGNCEIEFIITLCVYFAFHGFL